jgi:hypothetical protein
MPDPLMFIGAGPIGAAAVDGGRCGPVVQTELATVATVGAR